MPDFEYTVFPVRKRVIRVTLTNNQSTATPNPFQQSVYIHHDYLESLLAVGIEPHIVGLNTIFYDPQAGAQAYSWYLGYDGIRHYWWVKTQSIGANSTYTLYMIIDLEEMLIDGNIAGINSQYAQYYLGSAFANYDNGAKIFNAYIPGTNTSGWTIAGTAGLTSSPPSGNTFFPLSAYYVQSTSGSYMYTTASQSTNMIIEYYSYTNKLDDLFFLCNSSGAGQMGRIGNGSGWYGLATTSSWTSWNAPPNTGYWSNEWVTVAIVVNNGTAQMYLYPGIVGYGLEMGYNPSNTLTVTNNGNYLGLVGDAAGSSYYSWWNGIIIRQLPPNNTMPTVSFSLIN